MLITDYRHALTDHELEELDLFLKALSNSHCTGLTWLHGFLCAVVSAPNSPTHYEWLPVVCNANIDPQQARKFAIAIFKLYNIVKDQLAEKRPFEWLLWKDGKQLAYEDCPANLLAQWCQGYLHAVAMDKQWQHDEHSANFLHPLHVLANEIDMQHCNDDELKQQHKTNLFIHIKHLYDHWATQRKYATLADSDPSLAAFLDPHHPTVRH